MRRWLRYLFRFWLRLCLWSFTLIRSTPHQTAGRFYVDRFMAENSALITGRVLEVKDARYMDRLGHDVTCREILDIDAQNPQATICCDLQKVSAPDASFDCLIVTQVLEYVAEPRTAVEELYRILDSEGAALVTVPAAGRAWPDTGPERWRFLAGGIRSLFEEVFGETNVVVSSYGNLFTAVGAVCSLAPSDLPRGSFDRDDPLFPVIVTVKATKRT